MDMWWRVVAACGLAIASAACGGEETTEVPLTQQEQAVQEGRNQQLDMMMRQIRSQQMPGETPPSQ